MPVERVQQWLNHLDHLLCPPDAVDGIGIEVDGYPMTSVSGLARTDLAKLSFHDPAKAPRPPAGSIGPSPDIAALIAYAGPSMSDPTLAERLGYLDLPVHVI